MTDEKPRLCDWENHLLGGYGRSVTCADGATARTDPDEPSCVELHDRWGGACGLVAADVEACTLAMTEDLCMLFVADACEHVRACARNEPDAGTD